MSRFQVAYRSSDKHALVQYYGDDTITGHTNIGNFYHDGGGTDVLDGIIHDNVIGSVYRFQLFNSCSEATADSGCHDK